MKTADAVDLLTDDHLQVSALFKQYEKLVKKKAPRPAARSPADLRMLKAHTTIEEEIFYPAARKAGSRLPCSTRPTSSMPRPRT